MTYLISNWTVHTLRISYCIYLNIILSFIIDFIDAYTVRILTGTSDWELLQWFLVILRSNHERIWYHKQQYPLVCWFETLHWIIIVILLLLLLLIVVVITIGLVQFFYRGLYDVALKYGQPILTNVTQHTDQRIHPIVRTSLGSRSSAVL